MSEISGLLELSRGSLWSRTIFGTKGPFIYYVSFFALGSKTYFSDSLAIGPSWPHDGPFGEENYRSPIAEGMLPWAM